MIKLITFDLDNTLWEIDPVIIEAEKAMRNWVREHVPEAVALLEMDQLKGTYKRILEHSPEIRHHPTNMRKKILYDVFSRAQLEHNHALEMTEKAFAVFYKGRNQITLFHQAEKILQSLSKQYPLIALTNGNANLEMIGIERYFQAHFSSETEGHSKPHRAMFHRALNTMGVKPEQTIHIGDHPQEDIEAARTLGFHTIWFNQDQRLPPNSCQPSVEIHSLDNLLDAVDEIEGHKKSPE